MVNFTSNTYQMKREILSFSSKISKHLPKPERKFTADMNYGILASRSCLLTDIADQLHEPSKKINTVDRLSRHLTKGIPQNEMRAYLLQVKKWCPAHPVIHIDDSDIVKPDGYKFESLGWVRDGLESILTKNVYQKGYHVTEATVLTNSTHPVSIFSRIHSSQEKSFISINDITFSATVSLLLHWLLLSSTVNIPMHCLLNGSQRLSRQMASSFPQILWQTG